MMDFLSANKELIETLIFSTSMTLLAAICIAVRKQCDKDIKDAVFWMLYDTQPLSPGEFFELRSYQLDSLGVYAYSKYNFEGVYVIINKTKKKCYIESSKYVVDAIAPHFEGSGNKKIYNDYKNNNKFIIKMLKLKNSGFSKTKEMKKYISEICSKEYDTYE